MKKGQIWQVGGCSRANLVLKPNLTWLKYSQIEAEYYYRVIALFLCLVVVTGNCNPLAPFCISKPENASTVFSAMRFESLLSKAPLPVIAKCKKCLIYAHSVSIGEKRGHSCTMEILAFYAVKKKL